MNKKLLIGLMVGVLQLITQQPKVCAEKMLAELSFITAMNQLQTVNLNEPIPWCLNQDYVNLDDMLSNHQRYYLSEIDGRIPVYTYLPLLGDEITCDIFSIHQQSVSSLVSLKHGNIASASNDGTIKIWNPLSKKLLSILGQEPTVIQEENCVYSIIALRDQKHLVAAYFDGAIKVWDYTSGECVHIMNQDNIDPDGANAVFIVTQLYDGSIASGHTDGMIKIWNPLTGQCIREFREHSAAIYALLQLRNGDLVSACGQGVVKIWDVSTWECLHTLEKSNDTQGPMAAVKTLLESRRGGIVFSCGDGSIKFWDVRSGICSLLFDSGEGSLLELRNGNKMTYSSCGTIKIWNQLTGKCMYTLSRERDSEINAVIQLNNGNVAAAYCDGSVVIWHLYPEVVQGLSLKEYIFISSLEQFLMLYESVDLHKEWIDVFKGLPKAIQNKYSKNSHNKSDFNKRARSDDEDDYLSQGDTKKMKLD